MATVSIGEAALDPREVEAAVQNEKNGAVCTFLGQVRSYSRGKHVSYLEYGAFVPLAHKELSRIGEEAEKRWNVNVAIWHRVGRLEIGENSVVVSVGSPHRAEAFEACKWCMDTLKLTVPIWKRETGPDGSFWIEGEDALESGLI
jgi:molybdopterin synthase catalytic subunit